MRLRNKKTGKVYTLSDNLFIEYTQGGRIELRVIIPGGNMSYYYDSLAELNEEWEDYEPVEPLIKDEKIRKGIRAWWDMQGNPFKAAAVLCDKEKDLDGFYHWRIFGYIRKGEQKESTDLCFRTKTLYEYDSYKDYTKEELCGEEKE